MDRTGLISSGKAESEDERNWNSEQHEGEDARCGGAREESGSISISVPISISISVPVSVPVGDSHATYGGP